MSAPASSRPDDDEAKQAAARQRAGSRSTGQPGKAMADQIDTVAGARIADCICTLIDEEMARVERAIKVQLGLT
jgi:mRNA-degrading endonuclease toxin of MazEF toxin-antitoxin module